MKLTLAEVFRFGECTASSENFVEGEKLINSNLIMQCGKTSISETAVNIMAFCFDRTDGLDIPHLIKGEISIDGSIKTFQCSCKEESSDKCKHIYAVLLYCSRNNVEDLEIISEAEEKSWKELRENPTAVPLLDHPCYSKLLDKDADIDDD